MVSKSELRVTFDGITELFVVVQFIARPGCLPQTAMNRLTTNLIASSETCLSSQTEIGMSKQKKVHLFHHLTRY